MAGTTGGVKRIVQPLPDSFAHRDILPVETYFLTQRCHSAYATVIGLFQGELSVRWSQFADSEPEMARIGLQLLYNEKGGEVGILATVNKSGQANVSPVCPIFCDEGIYLLVAQGTPKKHHLRGNGSYALHAQVGADDLEFQIKGSAREIVGDNERERVIASIPFSSYDKSDPIFELLVECALTVSWPAPGVQDKRIFVEHGDENLDPGP